MVTTRQDDVALMQWPPRSPDLTPCDFFLVGICKGPPVLANLQELCDHIHCSCGTD